MYLCVIEVDEGVSTSGGWGLNVLPARNLKGEFVNNIAVQDAFVNVATLFVMGMAGRYSPATVGAVDVGTRSLDDLSSMKGATWEEAESLIPKSWTRGPLKKGNGIKFVNPKNKGEMILMEKGWPGATDPLHAGPYMRISRNGKITRIPLEGNPILK